MINENNSVST